MICPNCKGAKQSYIHVYYGPGKGSGFKWIPCRRCAGTGDVPDEQEPWIEEGKRLRAERLSRCPLVSSEQEAERLDLDMMIYEAMERGEIKPYTLP